MLRDSKFQLRGRTQDTSILDWKIDRRGEYAAIDVDVALIDFVPKKMLFGLQYLNPIDTEACVSGIEKLACPP
jgi:hypothetical protein